MNYTHIEKLDPEIFNLIKKEEVRLTDQLEMIPSENYASAAVMEANGSIFTNKYSEGYPHRRYYEGYGVVDELEELCQQRALQLFKADGYKVNVQAYSGSPANVEVYFALLEFGDTVLSMDLSSGTHLTHGSPVNFSGKSYNFVYYRLNPETHEIDYDYMEQMALEHKPKIILSGYTAYPRKVDFARVHEIAKKVGAISMADISHIAGLVAAGVHESPFPFTDIVTSTTHKTLRGPRGAVIFSKPEYADKIDKAVFPGMQGGPHNHTIAALAVALKEALDPAFVGYSKQVVENAKVLTEVLLNEGIKMISGGTDNHLLLLDLRNFGDGRGYITAKALDAAGIVGNRNSIHNEPFSPFYPSGVRLGTPAITTRGMKEEEMKQIGLWIARIVKKFAAIELSKDKAEREQIIKRALESFESDSDIQEVREAVKNLCQKFPVPGIE